MIKTIYFVSFVIFTSMVAFNVFIAVMTSQVQNKIQSESENHGAADNAIHEIRTTQSSELTAITAELRLIKAELGELRRAIR